MRKLGMILSILICTLLFSAMTWADQYRTVQSGNWGSTSTWEKSTNGGVTFGPTPTTPGASDTVFIQRGHTDTLTQNESCKYLNMCARGGGNRIVIGANTLNVYGALRSYAAEVGTTPGADTTGQPSSGYIVTSPGGKIKLVGTSRDITSSTSWSANPTTWVVEFALDPGETGTLNSNFKAGDITISSGIVNLGTSNTLRADSGSAGTGRLVISSSAFLIIGSGAIQRVATASSTSHFRTFTVDGTLKYTSTTVGAIGASTISFNGTIEYSASGSQTFVSKGGNSSGGDPTTYTNLKLSGSGTKTTVAGVTTSIPASGSLEMSGGATPPTLAIGSGGTFSVSSTSTIIVYTATGGQTTGIELDPNFQSAVIGNPAGVTLSGSKTINSLLVLSLGTLTLGSNNLTIAPGGSITFVSPTSYIVTNGTGVLKQACGGGIPVVFPVGNSVSPAEITNSATTDNFSVSVKSTFDNAPPNSSIVVNRQWTISEDSPGGSLATLTLVWSPTNEPGGFDRYSGLVIGRFNGTDWEETPAVLDSPFVGYYSATASGFTSFSAFAVGNATGLPIQLASSSASVIRGNDVEITWHTISETNNYGFEIQRKRGEQGDWSKIAFVEGHGTTLVPQSYSYIDRSVSFGKYYYRIKQIDLDGKSETFAPMEVSVGVGPDKFVLAQNYPNPFNPITLIEFVVPQSGFTTLKVYNVLGQEVATLFEGNAEAGTIHTVRFSATAGSVSGGDASNLSSGIYFYRLAGAGRIETKRMILLK